ncbi:hypothetical protein [Bradyrhizobium monzae]|nr:hypothetical protein [Bradyrhizobium sp. Oc8]
MKKLMPSMKTMRLLGISVSGFGDPEAEGENQFPITFDGFGIRV